MKKTYIKPSIEVVTIETTPIMAASQVPNDAISIEIDGEWNGTDAITWD